MSANSAKPRRRWGCLTRLLIFVLFIGACYWLLLAPLPERGADQPTEAGTSTPEVPAERVSIEGEVNPTQRAALEGLAAQSGGQADVLAQNGQIQYLTANVKVPDSVAVSAQEKASYFLQENRALFQVQDPSRDFKIKGRSRDEIGTTFIRYEQEYKGIPIYGSQAIVEVNTTGEVDSVITAYSPNLEIDVQPTIRSTQAEAIALEDLGDPNGEFLIPTNLVIYDARLFEETTPNMPRLAWEVMVGSTVEPSIRSYLVDAKTGDILLSLEEIMGARDRRVWNARRNSLDTSDPVTQLVSFIILFKYSEQVMNENGPLSGFEPNEDTQRAWRHAGTVYDYYYDHFRRDSYDGEGGSMELFVNIGNCGASLWVPSFSKAVFCDNVTSLDAVAHEITHGIWASRGIRAYYKGEAAALNESFSDIFAAFIDNNDPWRITADDTGQMVFRDLADPKNKNYSQYNKNADAYQNSTIHSYAVYLLAEGTPQGKQVNGVEVIGIGRSKAQYIYYDVMTNRLIYWVNFKEARKVAIASCKKLIGKHGITSSDCDQVMNAYAAVGIGEPAEQPSSPPISLPELPVNWLDTLREQLRQIVDDLLGEWNPLRLLEPIQAELDRIRNNYWVKLLECIRNSDQACINQYWADLINAILEMIVNELNNFCSSLFIVPIVVFAIGKQKRFRR